MNVLELIGRMESLIIPVIVRRGTSSSKVFASNGFRVIGAA